MAAVLLAALPSSAQVSPVFNMGMLANTMSMGATIKSECNRAARRGQPVPPDTPWCDSSATASGRQAFSRPAPASAAALPMRYDAPPALQREVLADFVERVRQHSVEDAQAVQAQLSRHDYHRVYDGIVGPYGLAGDDAANALAAYLVLGWMIVHGADEPPPGAVQGVRAQAAAALADGRLNSPQMRARLGEEFKVLFVVVHAGWQSSMRERQTPQYAAGIADMFRKTDGIDLRAMNLGPRGFRQG